MVRLRFRAQIKESCLVGGEKLCVCEREREKERARVTKRKKMDGKGQVILQPETVEVAQFRMPHFL